MNISLVNRCREREREGRYKGLINKVIATKPKHFYRSMSNSAYIYPLFFTLEIEISDDHQSQTDSMSNFKFVVLIVSKLNASDRLIYRFQCY